MFYRVFGRIALVLSLILAANLPSRPALAIADRGGSDAGGGDICESRIKAVRDDIRLWIQKGGLAGLTLPPAVSAQGYTSKMLAAIESTKVRCVGAGDEGFPVRIGSTPKICRFDRKPGVGRVTCDFVKFAGLSEADQYVLIHHEYAGLAGLENPVEDDSEYSISDQITAYLEDHIVKKLVVKSTQEVPDWVPAVSYQCGAPQGDFIPHETPHGTMTRVTSLEIPEFRDLRKLTLILNGEGWLGIEKINGREVVREFSEVYGFKGMKSSILVELTSANTNQLPFDAAFLEFSTPEVESIGPVPPGTFNVKATLMLVSSPAYARTLRFDCKVTYRYP